MTLEAKLGHYRISKAEFEKIKVVLGREPEGLEWALFSALWSEHCSYKSSKIHLKKLYNQSDRVLESFGENAGVIDLGEGERVAFKMESHNHPSFIEPYQGAATGVGGILRDIFTMGARPIALANYLCFGQVKAPRMDYLVNGVVKGIGGYGNCVGVPTITGQTNFDPSYDENILVNALAVGLFRPGENIFTSVAKGPGNLVVYVGAKTGRDGVHGASMASESFDDDSESKKPTVQIGDPFFEKCLIESCLEVMKEDLVVAIQDMGAAGLTSSSFEMASKGGVGLRLDLDKVPVRDSEITAEEIMLSESQERMLLICEPSRLKRIEEVFAKWGLDAVCVGEVLEDRVVKITHEGETLVEIDPDLLTESAPQYDRPYKDWSSPRKSETLPAIDVRLEQAALGPLATVHGNSREFIYQQYDQRVGAQTIKDCQFPVGVVRLPDSDRRLGLVLGCRPHLMRMDAYLGGQDSVIYPTLQLAAYGFKALALTDCLNFGNPEKPELMTELVAALGGMNQFCERFDVPIISGNVSLYNETKDRNVTSTPSTGLVGLRDIEAPIPAAQFQAANRKVLLLQQTKVHTTGAWCDLGLARSAFTGSLDADGLFGLQEALIEANEQQLISSSRVVGRFGLAYNLARMCLGGMGMSSVASSFPSEFWVSERLYEVIVEVDPSQVQALQSLCQSKQVTALEIGMTGGDQLNLESSSIKIDQLLNSYQAGVGESFGLA